ncbi:MAG: phosphoesterase [Synechococcus sp. MED-G70]|nr:MAG: phosphoesterase [Synechococcus sp. MED-G70]
MTFPLFWLPRRRSLSSREIRFERHDERAARAVELLPQPQPPLVAMELPEPIDPFAPEIVTVPDIPEPLSTVQEELDQMAQALVPPELPEPAFEIPPLDVPPLDVPPLDRPELSAPALDAVALNGADFGTLNPDPQPTVVARWNELALQAIRADKPVPTVITRALHLAHAAMYDTWAAFDPIAKGAYTDLRRSSLTPQRTIERAISHAAHSVLSTVFPHHSDRFDDLLEQLGFDSARHPMARFGRQVAESVLSARAEDGSNAGNGYDDPSGYASINQEGSGEFDPNRWTPLRIPNGTAVDENGIPIATDDPSTYTLQSPLTPHWGDVTPFAISDGAAFRPVAPPQLGDFSVYTDATGFTSTNDEAYRRQFTEVAAISATLTAEQKAIAEYWADGPLSSTPPGHWNEFAHDLSAREEYGLADDVKMFFALNNALFDTGIAVWDAKYAHDYVRPQTAIRHLFEDQEIIAWAGPNKGSQTILGQDWQPYQDVTFVTPAFPEYTSGHSGFSFAAATVLEAYTGSDVLFDGHSRGVQDLDGDGERDLIGAWSTDELSFEEYDGDTIRLSWNTLWDAAAQAGRSRLYGGIHIQDGDLRGRAMGQQVAETVWGQTESLFSGFGETSQLI